MNTTVLEKIQSELERSGCDAFLLSGGDNMRYAAQVHLPFTDEHPGLAFVLFAKGRLPLVLSPSLWARSWERGIISDVRAYPGSLDATHAAAELAAFLRPLGLASIGLDMNRASVALRDALGEWALTDISAAISAIRQIKSAEEAAFLEDLAYRADHAILGAAHHSLACDARAEKGQAELIRMHALERGFEAVGYNGISQSATGAHAKDYWAESPKFGIGQGKKTARDEMNRLDLQASLNGYWAFGSRLMTMGWPLPEQTKAYEGLVAMRKAALAAVRPGATCADLYAAMLDAAERAGVTPVTGVHWGHGIGVASQEAPWMAPGDATVLKEGMVLVLNPHVQGPGGTILYSRDTVLLDFNGCRRSSAGTRTGASRTSRPTPITAAAVDMGTVTRIGCGPAGLPFSRMTLKDGRFFLSGQVAQNPETGRIDHPGCYEQSLTVLGNIRGILAEAGFAPEQVAKMTVFLTDMGQKDAFDRAFERVFRRVPEEGDAPGSPEGPGTGEGGARAVLRPGLHLRRRGRASEPRRRG